MKVSEALKLLNTPASEAGPSVVQLVAGIEPLHLRTLLCAEYRLALRRTGRDVQTAVAVGLFGDWLGNLSRALRDGAVHPIVALLEWSDVHPSLGFRESAGPSAGAHLLEDVRRFFDDTVTLAGANGAERRRVLVLPSLPLPAWVGHAAPGQASDLELELRALLSAAVSTLSKRGFLVVQPIEHASPWHPAKHLATGFPYTPEYAAMLAERIAGLLVRQSPLKGLVTDLDGTLWKGIVGDDGPRVVSWDVGEGARPYGWWQQALQNLAQQGVLLGIVSKNDSEPVAAALARPDLLVDASAFYPVLTSWGPKAQAILETARRWNIGLEAMLFVDDNPLELELVQTALPQLHCRLFRGDDPDAVLQLLAEVRALFGRERIGEEDRLRSASIRSRLDASSPVPESDGAVVSLRDLAGRLVVRVPSDLTGRPLELVNKTNQFNLNGRRWTDEEWLAFAATPGHRVWTVAYQDRLGPLGVVAALAISEEAHALRIHAWVLSCRAFSRGIEHAIVRELFRIAPAGAPVVLDWKATPRNGPTSDFLRSLGIDPAQDGALRLEADRTLALLATHQALPEIADD